MNSLIACTTLIEIFSVALFNLAAIAAPPAVEPPTQPCWTSATAQQYTPPDRGTPDRRQGGGTR